MLARSLSRPIRDLTEGAVAIGQGELDRRIPVTGRDELSLLARRFNEMADELAGQRMALVAARDDLTTQVAERTGQLADANARLTDLDAPRARFLGDIGHELRTPLTVRRGEAEITLRGGAKDEAVYRGALEHIVAQAAAMGHLVDDLLFLARWEGDQIRLERKRLNVRHLIEMTGQEAEVLARRKQITVRTMLPDAAMNIVADERRLRQALVILIDNAIRCSSTGGESAWRRARTAISSNSRSASRRLYPLSVAQDRLRRRTAADHDGQRVWLHDRRRLGLRWTRRSEDSREAQFRTIDAARVMSDPRNDHQTMAGGDLRAVDRVQMAHEGLRTLKPVRAL